MPHRSGIYYCESGHEQPDMNDPKRDQILNALVLELERGIRTIAETDDFTYRRFANGSGSVGAQFRHILDFVGCLLRGIETGRVDYGARARDPRVETDREFAVATLRQLLTALSGLGSRVMGKSVVVRSEIDPDTWLPSAVAREVEFVHSHSVHHHALIAEKLMGFGVSVDAGLGISPSTAEYRRKLAA
jgi:hypothetical protein